MSRIINMLFGAIITLVGLYLWFHTDTVMQLFSVYLGAFFIVVAIVGWIVMKRMQVEQIPYGQLSISAIIGCVFLFLPTVSYAIATWIFIVIVFLFALFNVVKVTMNKKRGRVMHLIQVMISFLFIIYAIVMLVNPELGGRTLARLVAFFIIMNGVSYFFSTSTWE